MAKKLMDVSCPRCGAALQITSNAKVITCEYCNHDFVLEEDIKKVRLDGAEKAGYEFEKGRIRVKREEKERKAKTLGKCPYCHELTKIPQFFEKYGRDTVCSHCGKPVDAAYCSYLWDAEICEAISPNRSIDYYNKILGIDPSSTLAKEGIQRAKYHLEHYVYITAYTDTETGQSGKLELQKDVMTFTKGNIKEIYYYSKMGDTIYYSGNHVSFTYPARIYRASFKSEVNFRTVWGKDIAQFIINAKNGIYPEIN